MTALPPSTPFPAADAALPQTYAQAVAAGNVSNWMAEHECPRMWADPDLENHGKANVRSSDMGHGQAEVHATPGSSPGAVLEVGTAASTAGSTEYGLPSSPGRGAVGADPATMRQGVLFVLEVA